MGKIKLPQCEGMSRQTGLRCKNPVIPGRRYCKFHGGRALAGIKSMRFTDGRHFQYLPGRLLERYREARGDIDLLAMRDEIALLDARLNDLLERVDTGEAGRLWTEARLAYAGVVGAMRSGDSQSLVSATDRLGQALSAGQGDYAAWEEVQKTIDLRRKISEAERKRLVDMQQMVTAEEAMNLVAAIAETVKRHIHDAEIIERIATDINRLINKPVRESIETDDLPG